MKNIAAIVHYCTEDLRLELQNSFASLDVVNFVDLREALFNELENMDDSSDMRKPVHDAPIVPSLEDVDLAPVPMPQPVTTRFFSLTNDKLPSSQIMIPASKPPFYYSPEKCANSFQILRRWGRRGQH